MTVAAATATQQDAERLVLLCALGSRAAVLVLCAAFDAAVRFLLHCGASESPSVSTACDAAC